MNFSTEESKENDLIIKQQPETSKRGQLEISPTRSDSGRRRRWLMARALKLARPTRGSPTRKVNKRGFPNLQQHLKQEKLPKGDSHIRRPSEEDTPPNFVLFLQRARVLDQIPSISSLR